MFVRTQPAALFHFFCEFMFYSQAIFLKVLEIRSDEKSLETSKY